MSANCPPSWTPEERQFIGNWMREQARLTELLLCVAGDRPKFLRKAKKVHLKLSYQLNRQICDLGSRDGKAKHAPAQHGTAHGSAPLVERET
jgi:hypothetical protein